MNKSMNHLTIVVGRFENSDCCSGNVATISSFLSVKKTIVSYRHQPRTQHGMCLLPKDFHIAEKKRGPEFGFS